MGSCDFFGHMCFGTDQGRMHRLLTALAEGESMPGEAEDSVIRSGPPDHDPVNHPSHYTGHPSGVECITITRHMTFNLGNVVKYVWRAGSKQIAPTIEDLEKARWYLTDEIDRRKKEEASEGKSEPAK